MKNLLLPNLFSKLRIHIFALALIAILVVGIVVCYFSGDNVILLEPGTWNMDALTFVH